MSVLVTFDIIELFVNTFTTEDRYSLCNRKNLPHPNKMQLSEKQKILSEVFAVFLKSTSRFEHFEKKMTFMSYVFPKFEATKDVVR